MKKLMVVLAAFAMTGCAQAVKTSLDISDSVCTELEKDKQTDPLYVQFICTAVHIGNGLGQSFLAKVKKEDAPTFAARHCAQGEVAP